MVLSFQEGFTIPKNSFFLCMCLNSVLLFHFPS